MTLIDKEQPSIRSVEDKEHRDLLNTSLRMVKRPFYHNAVHGPCLSMREEQIFILRPVMSKSSPKFESLLNAGKKLQSQADIHDVTY